MARPRTLSDDTLLDEAVRLMHQSGPAAVTFGRLAKATGLSASTLVQRFGSKPELVRSALLRAWDHLDQRTAELAGTLPKTPDGAVEFLARLSSGYGDIGSYAEGLLILREDLRDPVLRARGAAWKQALSQALDDRLTAFGRSPGLGLLMATHWQGSLLWWSFEPVDDVVDAVRRSLRAFLTVLGAGPGPRHAAQSVAGPSPAR